MNNKVCLVTGVGEGTGAAIARRFASSGYRVAMLARNEERLAALEKELGGSRAFAFDLGGTTRCSHPPRLPSGTSPKRSHAISPRGVSTSRTST